MDRPADNPQYTAMFRSAFGLARQLGCKCGPAHLLIGLSEGDGPVAAALVPAGGSPLRSFVTAADGTPGEAVTYVNQQAQQGARQWAESRGEALRVEQLAVVLIDQAAPDTVDLLTRAGVDGRAVRRAALEALGAPPDLASVALPVLTPAGTSDRPPLPVGELDPRAWAALCWRQDHLPLHRLRSDRDWAAMGSLEAQAAQRVASRIHLDDDRRYSLLCNHCEQVEAQAARARPDLAERSDRQTHSQGMDRIVRRMQRRRRWYRRPGILSFTAGWACWFSNRRAGLRNRWFRLRTLPSYRGAPRLGP